jgi:broad specificity phosphatase PhoE
MMIHLLRHGQFGSDGRGGHPEYYDPGLNDLGKRQSEALGRRLREHYPIDVVYTSDLRRAFQTAEIVAQIVGAEMKVDIRFREVYRGECEFQSLEDIKELYPAFYDEWMRRETDFRYPKGESGQDVWDRASEAMTEIVSRRFENVAIVTHGGVIMALLCGYLGSDLANRFKFSIGLCSINSLIYDAVSGRFTITRVGDTAHLEGL